MGHRSSRVPSDLSANRLTEARRRKGEIPFDLTISNPTVCGISYPGDLLAGLGDRRGLEYQPEPQGPLYSRKAIAAEYDRWGTWVDPERIFLTASTSEAYSHLFRLLCDPGDTILFPSPSYPLFDQLARLDGVEPRSYDLDPDGDWRIDFSTIEEAPQRVRAIVVVHPNNPTGSFVHTDDADRLVGICRDRGWALIADEVFLPYPLDAGPGGDATFAAVENCLCFSLGGLSKSVGLPQAKLAWITVCGPLQQVQEATAGLEWVSDAFLSTSTPVALATPEIIEAGRRVRRQISARCRRNLEALRELVRPYPSISVSPVGGGWSAVLRVPAVQEDEDLCIRLLEERGVALLPGLFFDFPRSGYLVASLIVREELFREGMAKALCVIGDTAGLGETTVHKKRRRFPALLKRFRASQATRSRLQKTLPKLAAVGGLAALGAGTWMARSTGTVYKAWPYFNARGEPSISAGTIVLASIVVLGLGGSILARLAGAGIPRLMMADRIPGVTLRRSLRGFSLLGLAASSLTVLCYIASIERHLFWYTPLLLATIMLALAGLKASDISSGNRQRRVPAKRVDRILAVLLACTVVWSATRALADWKFGWIGDEGNFYFAALGIARGAVPSIFNIANVYNTHPVVDSAWQAIFIRIFGEGVVGWKLSEVAVAAIAAVLVFAVVSALGRSSASHTLRLSALIGGLTLGCSAYTLAFVQTGYNNLHTIVPPLLVMLALIALRRRPRATTLFGLGCLLGLCLYTFLATILIWIVVAVFLAPGLVSQSPRTHRSSIAIVVAGFAVMVVPLVLSEPSALFAGLADSNTVAIGDALGQNRNIIAGMARSFLVFWHNPHWFDHYVGGPLLGPVGGALAITGIAGAWINRRRSPGDRFVLLWFVLGVVLVALSSDHDRPRLTRLLFVMPAASILAARGAMIIAQVLRCRLALSPRPVMAVLLGAALSIPPVNMHQLYVVSPTRRTPHPNTFVLRALQENPQSRVFDITPTVERNRALMIELFPWFRSRYEWIGVEDLGREFKGVDADDLLLVYDREDAARVHNFLPENWSHRPYPGPGYPHAIWCFSTDPIGGSTEAIPRPTPSPTPPGNTSNRP